MQLFEALKTIRDCDNESDDTENVALLCGFTPLHLRTFLTAHLLKRNSSRGADVEIGLFGDLLGNIERATQSSPHNTALLIEWSDLDPRLGYRSSGGWRPDGVADIIESVQLRLRQLRAGIEGLSEVAGTVVSLPTLPLPPMFQTSHGAASADVLALKHLLSEFALQLAGIRNVRLLDTHHLDLHIAPAARFDAASDLRVGFPFTMAFASELAEQLAGLIRPQPALKGIITDLDNTLWSGIVGDDGPEAVSWDLDHKTHHHALYQEQLASLSAAGVLVAIASKNEITVAREALNRKDLIFPADRFFPIEAGWEPKSRSVARILKAWNISEDAVAFIDDNPMELAEVAEAFPRLHCRQFPTSDETAVLDLLAEMRALFGRDSITNEDRIRVESLRTAQQFQDVEVDTDEFLEKASARITFEWNAPDNRCFELINKTNQFNLNGHRIDESQRRRLLANPRTILLAVEYQDKFGPLGKIAVAVGQHTKDCLEISHWVLSCRAFSRRIEHATVRALFESTGCNRLAFDFQSTERNNPLQHTLTDLTGHTPESGVVMLDRSQFESTCPNIYAEVTENEFNHPLSA